MLFSSLLPPAFQDNPMWLQMAKVFDDFWGKNVNQYIVDLLNVRNPDVKQMDRNEFLRMAKFLGWSFNDSFGADWESNPKAEAFIRTFVATWSEFCRQGKESPHFVQYMSLLLGLPITMSVMWSKVHTSYDDGGCEDGFLLPNTAPPVYPTVSYDTLVRFENLDTYEPGWQSIIDDPVNGWYPTTHVEIEYTSIDMLASAIPGVQPEELVSSLFYAIAPIQLVLKNISVTFSIETEIHINLGFFTEEEYF